MKLRRVGGAFTPTSGVGSGYWGTSVGMPVHIDIVVGIVCLCPTRERDYRPWDVCLIR